MHRSRVLRAGQWLTVLWLSLPVEVSWAESKKGSTQLAATSVRRPPDPNQASKAERRKAQLHYERGKQQFEAKQFDAAFENFTLARAVVSSPNVELYRARCLIELGRLTDAYRLLGEVVLASGRLGKTDGRYQKTQQAARLEQQELARRLAFVAVTAHHTPKDARLFINGREVPRSAWSEPIVTTPGKVEVSLRGPGATRHQKRVTVPAGGTRQVVLDLGTHALEGSHKKHEGGD